MCNELSVSSRGDNRGGLFLIVVPAFHARFTVNCSPKAFNSAVIAPICLA